MILEAVWIGFAFSLGMLVRLIGLPPLVGYLAARFYDHLQCARARFSGWQTHY